MLLTGKPENSCSTAYTTNQQTNVLQCGLFKPRGKSLCYIILRIVFSSSKEKAENFGEER